jgi:hypothetical protein
MKIAILILTICIFPIKTYSQIDSLKTKSLDVEILVHDLDKIKSALKILFERNNIVPDLFNEANNQFFSNFVLNEKSYYTFVNVIESWGVIDSRKIESVNCQGPSYSPGARVTLFPTCFII